MKRREFITLLTSATAASSLSCLRTGRAQPAGKVYRIGILETNSPLTNAANFDALRKGMMELGYIEGQTLFFEYRSADGRNERFPDLVRAARRGGAVAARSARAAAGDAGDRISWKSYGARPTRAAICLRCSRTVKAPRSKATAGLLKLTRSVSHLDGCNYQARSRY